MHAIILDTETTGLDEPQVIQLAQRGPLEFRQFLQQQNIPETRVERFLNTKPISIGALATHHILEEELRGLDPFPAPWQVPAEVGLIVGHGIDHDWEAMGKPEVMRICTLAIAKYYWPDLDSYKLTALIYHLYEPRVAREMVKDAHDAGVDVALTALVLDHMMPGIVQGDRVSLPVTEPVRDWYTMWLLSEECRIPRRVDFGMYGPRTPLGGRLGLLYSDVALGQRGRSYLRDWMLKQSDMDPYKLKAARRALGMER